MHLQWTTVHLQRATVHLQQTTVHLQWTTVHLQRTTVHLQRTTEHLQRTTVLLYFLLLWLNLVSFFPPLLFLLFLHKHFICFYMSLKLINCQNKQYFLLLICMSILKYSLGLLWIYLGFCHASLHCRSLNFIT